MFLLILQSILIAINAKCLDSESTLTSIIGVDDDHIIGRYTGDSFDITQNIWADVSGKCNNIEHEQITDIFINKRNGLNSHPFIFGTADSKIVFPVTFKSNQYSLFYVTRYFGDTQHTIFQNENGNNWYSGFYNGKSGISYHNNKILSTSNMNEYRDSWIIVYDEDNTLRINKRNDALLNITHNNDDIYDIKLAAYGSDFAISEVIIFNKALSDATASKIETFLSGKYNVFEIFWIDQLKTRHELARKKLTRIKNFLSVNFSAEYVEVEFDIYLNEEKYINTFSLGELDHYPTFWLKREYINESLEHRIQAFVYAREGGGMLSAVSMRHLTGPNKLGTNETHHVYMVLNPLFFYVEIDGEEFCGEQLKKNASQYYLGTEQPIITFWSWYNFSFRTQETYPFYPVTCGGVCVADDVDNDRINDQGCDANDYRYINVYCGDVEESTVFSDCYDKKGEDGQVQCDFGYYMRSCNGQISWDQTCVMKDDIANVVCCKSRSDVE